MTNRFDYRTATAQQVFDYVVTALLKQGHISYENGSCQYRASNGDKCAAGHLISDDDYRLGMENKAWDKVVREFPEQTNKAHFGLICDLQMAHDGLISVDDDNSFNLNDFGEQFGTVAFGHDLDRTVLQGIKKTQ